MVVPVLHREEVIVNAVQFIPQESVQDRTVDVPGLQLQEDPVSQVIEDIVKLVRLTPRE